MRNRIKNNSEDAKHYSNVSRYRETRHFGDIHKERRITLLELLDKALNKGIVISGDIVISAAEVDLIYIGLRALISSVETMERLKSGDVIPMGG